MDLYEYQARQMFKEHGVPVLDYLPWATFCWLCLLLTLAFGFSGRTISRA